MALMIPQKGLIRTESNITGGGSEGAGQNVITGGTASTKGSPVELIAATSFDAYWVTIIAQLYGTAATVSQGALDILIGTSTEAILIPDLLMGYCGGEVNNSVNGPKTWQFPLYIAAGNRIAAQAAGARISTAVRVGIILEGGHGSPGHHVGSRVTTYGMGTVPDGTTVTAGSSGAEGSWTEITASTTRDHFAFLPSLQPTGDTTVNNRHYRVDIGIGAAAAEEEIASNYLYATSSAEQMTGPMNSRPQMQHVPSGTRLALRASCHATPATLNAVIHAVS
jgi:hypothetical protein